MGVKELVEKIEVKLPSSLVKGNAEIAVDVLSCLKSNWSVPETKISVKVEDGWVTLEGELGWNYQKDAATRAITYIDGIKGITNNITIKSESTDIIEQQDIEAAIAKSWSVDDKDIHVHVSGTTVKLTGSVGSFYQKEEAGRIAWNIPGIWHLENELAIDYYHALAR